MTGKHDREPGRDDLNCVSGVRSRTDFFVNNVRLLLWIVVASLSLTCSAAAQESGVSEQPPGWLVRAVTTAQQTKDSVVQGQDGWLYPVSELRALSVGRFWGADAGGVSRASKPESADPLPAILDFQQQLQRAGLQLILVPVPAKAVIYPEPLEQPGTPIRWSVPEFGEKNRLDQRHREFYEVLRKAGVDVLDLVPEFLQERFHGGELYCRTDSHWTPRGAQLAAAAVTARVGTADWLQQMQRDQFDLREGTQKVQGDLAGLLSQAPLPQESVRVMSVTTTDGKPVSSVDRNSPVVVLGDSHTLIFHDPDLYGCSSGFVDFLAQSLGIPVDLVGVRGSGATTTRIELLRRRDRMAGKRVVIWCFSVREFTESETGWRKVPVIPSEGVRE